MVSGPAWQLLAEELCGLVWTEVAHHGHLGGRGAELRYQLWHHLLWPWGPVKVSSYGMVGQDAGCVGAKEHLTEGCCSLLTLMWLESSGHHIFINSKFWQLAFLQSHAKKEERKRERKKPFLCKTQNKTKGPEMTEKMSPGLIGRINWLDMLWTITLYTIIRLFKEEKPCILQKSTVKPSSYKVSLLTTSLRREEKEDGLLVSFHSWRNWDTE